MERTDLPVVTAGQDCDGENPATGRPCLLGQHKGFHRDDAGAEWLDDE